MYQFLIAIHVTTAVLLVVFILLQQGKGASTGASFGSGASNTVFGSSGSAGFMSRTTWFLVAVFFMVNLALAYLTNKPRDTMQDFTTQPVIAPAADEVPASEPSSVPEVPSEPSTTDVPDE